MLVGFSHETSIALLLICLAEISTLGGSLLSICENAKSNPSIENTIIGIMKINLRILIHHLKQKHYFQNHLLQNHLLYEILT